MDYGTPEKNLYQQAEDGFISEIQRQRGGVLEEKLDDELRKAVAATCTHGGKSTITLKIEVAKDTKYEDVIGTRVTFTSNLPQPKINMETRFKNNKNGITEVKQEQQALPLEHGKQPVKQLLVAENKLSRIGDK